MILYDIKVIRAAAMAGRLAYAAGEDYKTAYIAASIAAYKEYLK